MVIHGLWAVVAAVAIVTIDLASERWATAMHNRNLIDMKRVELEWKRHDAEREDAKKFFKSWDTSIYSGS